MKSETGHNGQSKTARRRGRRADGIAPRDLPKPVIQEIRRLAIGSTLPVSAIDAQLGIAALGVNLGTLQKYVGEIRRTAGVIATPRGPSGSRPRVEHIAAALHTLLTASFPAPIVEAVVRRLNCILSIDGREIASIASGANKPAFDAEGDE